jgi:hypothetical protein
MERKLIPSDSVLAERLLMKRLFEEIALLLVCAQMDAPQRTGRHTAKIQRCFMPSPGNLRHSNLHVTRQT